jgi:hypothetical protein
MNKREQARRALSDHVIAQPREHGPAGAPGIDGCRHTGGQAKIIGMAETWLVAVEKMSMDVDKTGSYEMSGNVDTLARFIPRDFWRDRSHDSIRESYVATSPKILTRIYHFPALQ